MLIFSVEPKKVTFAAERKRGAIFASSSPSPAAGFYSCKTLPCRFCGIAMLMLCILIKKWQRHPKAKSGQNLISNSYLERVEEKGKRKDWEEEKTNIKRVKRREKDGGQGGFCKCLCGKWKCSL